MLKKRHEYSNIGVSVQEVIFDNGLTLLLIPRPHFNEKQVMISTPFGSTTHLMDFGDSQVEYPFGLAHFLEHKIFEMSDGKDALEEFTALGAEANAFTTYQQTVYYFSTVNEIREGVTKLLELVSECHITEQSVADERPIIKNELLMYEDDSDYQMTKALLANLYPNSAISQDIGGSNDSIDQIGVADLIAAHQHFYAFNQLTMVVVGDIDVNEIVNEVDKSVNKTVNTEDAHSQSKYKCLSTGKEAVTTTSRLTMDIAQPKLGIGFRVLEDLEGVSLSNYKLGLRLFLAMVFGWTSETYQKWYDNGWVDYSFDFHLEVMQSYRFITITLDTDQPIAMTRHIKKLLQNYSTNPDFSEEHLSLLKKEMYGDFIKSLDSIDQLANNVTLSLADGDDFLTTGDVIRKMSLSDVKLIADHFVSHMESTTVTIFPK